MPCQLDIIPHMQQAILLALQMNPTNDMSGNMAAFERPVLHVHKHGETIYQSQAMQPAFLHCTFGCSNVKRL